MKRILQLGAVTMMALCAMNAQTPVSPLVTPPSAPRPTLTTFTNLPKILTYDELVRRAGPPDKDIGSGIFIWIYQLADGSTISASSGDADGKRINSVTHIARDRRTELYRAK